MTESESISPVELTEVTEPEVAAVTCAEVAEPAVKPLEPESDAQLSGEDLLSILAAAVVTVCGPGARIVGVRSPKYNYETSMTWSREGRREIHLSHRLEQGR